MQAPTHKGKNLNKKLSKYLKQVELLEESKHHFEPGKI